MLPATVLHSVKKTKNKPKANTFYVVVIVLLLLAFQWHALLRIHDFGNLYFPQLVLFVALFDLMDEMLLSEAQMFSSFMVGVNILRSLHLGKPLTFCHMSTSKSLTSILHSLVYLLQNLYSLTSYACASKYHGFLYM